MLAIPSQSAKLVELFHAAGIRQEFNKNEFIIHPGEAPMGVFYILEGHVKAYDITKYQEENLLVIRKEEEVFPLIWALTGKERSIVYQAMSPTKTLMITREKLLKTLDENPILMAPLLDMAIEMYRLHSERILNLEYRSVRERIVSFLLSMSSRFGAVEGKGVKIQVPLRHQDIASSINASRETASRELSALERRGFISSKQSYLTILDAEGLKKFIG